MSDVSGTIDYIQKYISEKQWSIQYASYGLENDYRWFLYDSDGKEVTRSKSIEDIADEIARMQYNNVAKFNTKIFDALESNNDIADKLAALAVTVSSLQNSIEANTDDHGELRRRIRTVHARVGELEAVVAKSNERLDAAARIIDDNHNDHGVLRNKIKETNKRIAIAENKAIAHEDVIGAIHDSIDKLEQRVDENWEQDAVNTMRIEKLEDKLQDQGCGSIYAVQERITSLTNRVNNICVNISPEDIANLKEEMGKLHERVNCLDESVNMPFRPSAFNPEDIADLKEAVTLLQVWKHDFMDGNIDNIKETLAEHNELLSKILDALEVDRDKLDKLIKDDALTDEFVAEQWYGIDKPISDIIANERDE